MKEKERQHSRNSLSDFAQVEEFQNLFNNVSDAVYIQDARGCFLDINDSVLSMYGYPKEQIIGQTTDFLSAPGMNDHTHLKNTMTQAFEGHPQEFEFWGRRANGEIFLKNVHLRKSRYRGQDVVMAIARNLSGDLQAEKQLLESEYKYRQVMDNTLEGIYVIQDRRIIFCNYRFQRMFGYDSPEDVVGRHISEFVYPADIQKVEQSIVARETGVTNIVNYEFRGQKKDGTLIHAETLGSSILYDDQPAIQGSMRDITELVKASEEKIRLENQLKQSQKLESIGTLASGVAHEINNPLTGIINYADV